MKTANLLFLVFLVFSKSYGQDPQLIDNTWYLEELTLDGSIVPIPDTEELDFVELVFELDQIETTACNFVQAGIFNWGTSHFEMSEPDFFTGGACVLQSTIDFEEAYFFNFFQIDFGNNMVEYVIESGSGDTLQLTLTMPEGDTAIYNNNSLSVVKISETNFKLFPNPTSNSISLQLENDMIAQQVLLYNFDGKLIYSEIPTPSEIIELSLSELPSGLYFVKIIDSAGKFYVRRIIKH